MGEPDLEIKRWNKDWRERGCLRKKANKRESCQKAEKGFRSIIQRRLARNGLRSEKDPLWNAQLLSLLFLKRSSLNLTLLLIGKLCLRRTVTGYIALNQTIGYLGSNLVARLALLVLFLNVFGRLGKSSWEENWVIYRIPFTIRSWGLITDPWD